MNNGLKTTLVVIPARGGSKRIPQKNIKPINGQPMIYWPLMTLNKLFKPSNVLVSTDSKHIKNVVEAKGLNVPFLRPKELSGDFIGTIEVIMHALDWYENNKKSVDFVLIVYPTALFLKEQDIKISMKKLNQDPLCDTIMSAAKYSVPPQWALFNNTDGYAEMFEPDSFRIRSQDLIESFYDAGQFYLSRASVIRRGALITNSKVKLHFLHHSKVVDIDTIEDFEIAEEKLRQQTKLRDHANWSF